MKGNPGDNDHIFRSVSDKATNDNEAFRYQSIDEMRASFQKVLNYYHNAEQLEKLEENIRKGVISEETHEYINSFHSKKLFERLQDKAFQRYYVKLLNSNLETENHIQNKLSDLFDYVQGLWRKDFKELDCLGEIAIPIILGKHDFVTKEVAIHLLNIPLSANRFDIQNRVKEELIGNIEPSFEELI